MNNNNLQAGFDAARIREQTIRDHLVELNRDYGQPFSKARNCLMSAKTYDLLMMPRWMPVYKALFEGKPSTIFGIKILVSEHCPDHYAYLMDHNGVVIRTLKLTE